MVICLIGYLGAIFFYVFAQKKIDSFESDKKVFRRAVLFLVGAITVAFVLELQNIFLNQEIEKIKRRDYEEGQLEESLRMQIEGEKEQKVDITISPRKYTDEEIQDLLKNAMDEIEIVMLGKNKSADMVTEDLHLPTSLEDYPFNIRWEFSRYDVMDSTGKINQDVLKQIDPERKGVLMTVSGILSFEEKESVYATEIIVYPKETQTQSLKEQVMELIRLSDSESQQEMYMNLPDVIDNKSIVWKKEKQSVTIPLLLIGIAGSIFLVYTEKEKRATQLKKQQKQMLFDYPEIISQFTVLMGAGMSTKNVWKKIVEDYRKQKERTGKIRWIYEEMSYTYQEMQSGVPETECYEHFVKRIDLMPYMKLGTLLIQNLRKGTKGMWAILEVEAYQAMEERKSQVKKLGEEAGTKLLLPMFLMLVVVLLIVIIPAFVSIQI